ncbi:MAG: Na/Pi cotransporter family protein [Bacillota bacterium]
MSLGMLFNLLGGLGLFIYGMKQMADGLQKTAGKKLRKLLGLLTTNRIAGLLVGTGVTAIIQSSSATTVMVVGFVNAGLMTLKQSIGVIMGANIGTTITAQLIAFKLTNYSFHAIALGAALYLFGSKKKTKYVGQVFLGFGILFLGLSTMKETMAPLRDSPVFITAMEQFGKTPILGVLLGAAITVIVQSSSASMGILIGLVSVGAINYQAAVPILLGDNIGTTVTALLSSIGTNTTAKRSAIAHMIFNVIGSVVFILALYSIPNLPALLEKFFISFSHYFGQDISAERMLANTHSVFNVINALVWLPFVGFMVQIVTKLVPEQTEEPEQGLKYIDERMLQTPGVALDQTHKEIIHMTELSHQSVIKAQQGLVNEDEELIAEIKEQEEIIDRLECEIVAYLAKISDQQALSTDDKERINCLLKIVDAVESIGDNAENIASLTEYKIEENLKFTDQAISEIDKVFGKLEKMLNTLTDALADYNHQSAKQILELEGEVDRLEEDYRDAHLKRLNGGSCVPVAGVIYLEVLKNVEHIGDQITKISYSILEDIK